jgi:hypothetical protein
VVGVVDPAAFVDDRLGVGGEDRVRAERADLANELLAQREVVGKSAVGLMEEAHPGITDDRRGCALLCLAQSREPERVGIGVLAALVAAGTAHEPPLGPGVDPSGGRPGRPELGVVGVRGDDHEAGRSPRMVGPGPRLVRLGHRAGGGAGRARRITTRAPPGARRARR